MCPFTVQPNNFFIPHQTCCPRDTPKFEFLFTENTVEIITETLICRKEIKRYRRERRDFLQLKLILYVKVWSLKKECLVIPELYLGYITISTKEGKFLYADRTRALVKNDTKMK